MPAPTRSRSIYGYALYIGSNCIFLLYLIWAFVPDETLRKYSGMSEWPSKYWAVAIPVWVGTAFAVFAALIYPAINMSITPDIDDIRTIRDKHSLSYKPTVPGGIPVVYDIPITDVCRKLYLRES